MEVQSCEECSYKSKLLFGMIYHERRHRSNSQGDLFSCEKHPNLYSCPHCYFETDLSIVLKEHAIGLHKNEETEEVEDYIFSSFDCETCKFQTFSVLVMLKHFTDGCTKTEEPFTFGTKPFECCQCQYATNNKSQLNTHKICKHTTPEDIKWLECDRCELKFKIANALRQHTKRIHEIEWHQCAHCPYKAKNKSDLRKHTYIRHSDPSEIKWFECDKCESKFKTANLLKYHVKQRHEIEWHQCAQCPYKTAKKTNLRRHTYNKHTDSTIIKWFQCDNCSYKGNSKNNLKRHLIRQHSKGGENAKFPCAQCSYVAKQKRYLDSHVISKHTSEELIKWHICDQCQFKTKLKAYLTKHKLNKHCKVTKGVNKLLVL